MRKGFTLIETAVAVTVLSIVLAVVVMALRSGSDATADVLTQTLRHEDEQKTMVSFEQHVRSADPASFILSGSANGCMLSFRTASPQAEHDLRGRIQHDISVFVTYDADEQTLKIESFYINTVDDVYQPAVVLTDVEGLGIYYHKKYRALQMVFLDHVSTMSVRTDYELQEDGKIHYNDPPFIPMELHWSNLDEELPLIAEIRAREEDDGSKEIGGKNKK